MSGDAAGDLDPLGQLPDRQLQVDAQAGADLHLDVVGERDREAGFLGRHDVDAAFDRDELVGAVAGGGPGHRDAGRRVGQRDLGVGHDGAGLVADRADDRRGFELRARRRGAREQQDHTEQDSAAGTSHVNGLPMMYVGLCGLDVTRRPARVVDSTVSGTDPGCW